MNLWINERPINHLSHEHMTKYGIGKCGCITNPLGLFDTAIFAYEH